MLSTLVNGSCLLCGNPQDILRRQLFIMFYFTCETEFLINLFKDRQLTVMELSFKTNCNIIFVIFLMFCWEKSFLTLVIMIFNTSDFSIYLKICLKEFILLFNCSFKPLEQVRILLLIIVAEIVLISYVLCFI